MNRLLRSFLFACLLLAGFATYAFAQDQQPEFRVHARRNMGYGNGSDVRGNFSLELVGPADTVKAVTYKIDGKEVGSYTAAPFKYQFQTSQYPDGWHEISAVVTTLDGRTVATPAVALNFISAGQESATMQRIIIPVIALLLVVTAIGVGSQFLLMRRHPERLAPGAERHYGLKGGTICPRCGRAYAIHFWSINLIGGALDRCDYCGKWAVVRSRSRQELDDAVQAERKAAQAGEAGIPGLNQAAESEEERLKKLLDESRFTG